MLLMQGFSESHIHNRTIWYDSVLLHTMTYLLLCLQQLIEVKKRGNGEENER